MGELCVHDSFSLTSNKAAFVGCFAWMKNSAKEAKRFWLERGPFKGLIDYVAMDSKTDDYDFIANLPDTSDT